MLFQPKLTVDHNMTVEADARVAQPVKVTVPDPAAQGLFSLIEATISNGDWTTGFSGLGDGSSPVFSARLDGQTPYPGLLSDVAQVSAVPGPDGTATNSPTMYQGAWFMPGTFPTGFLRSMTPQTTAKVDMVLHKRIPDTQAVPLTFAYPKGNPFGGGWAVGVVNDLPLHRTVYFSTDPSTMFQTELDEFQGDDFNTVGIQTGKFQTYAAGSVQTEHWNNAVFATSFASAGLPWQFLTRLEDTLLLSPPVFSDGDGHAGYSVFTSAKSTLWRNGKVIATDTTPYLEVQVPPEPADYKYTVEVRRGGPFSTKVTSTWTFKSKHVPASDDPFGGFEQLPVTAIGFAPAVDDLNRVAPGQIAIVPVTVSTQSGGKPLKSLTVDSSINGGLAWKPASVFQIGSAWYALVQQKSGATVSLRAHGVDTGNKPIDVTVIGAYQVR
jgi:hypothetical protein